MKRKLALATIVAAALAAARALSAGPAPSPVWVPTGGPVGGLGYDVRIHPADKSLMFVTDNYAGVIRSADAGRTWRASNTGITVRGGPTGDAYSIFSLTIDPISPQIVWAGTNGDNRAFGVFKSVDGGLTWAVKNAGITDAGHGVVLRGFTVDPRSSSVVYAMAELPTAAWGREFNRTQGRIYRTTDGGDSWTAIWSGDSLARYLVVDPEHPATLYASTGIFDREAANSDCARGVAGAGGVGVLKSTDGGGTWVTANAGLTDLYVGALRMHPTDPRVLFAATGNNACSGQYEGAVVSGLFRTTDGAASWQKVIAGDIVTTVAFAPSNPQVVYAGSARAFWRSADGGGTWARHSKPSGEEWGPPGVRAGVPIDVTVDPDDPDLLYANNYGGGVFRSTDGGASWEEWSRGYSGAEVHALAVADGPSPAVLAVGRSGPYRTENHGFDWAGIGTGAANFPEWNTIAAQPGHPEVILAADEHQGVILRSADGGASFAEMLRHPAANAAAEATRMGFKALAFAPSAPAVAYAALAKHRGTIDTSAPVGDVLWRSVDGGATFQVRSTQLNGLNVHRLLVDATDASAIWAATSGGLYRSIDGGASWARNAALGARVIATVAVDPAAPAHLVVSEKNVGIWRSDDGGASWPGGPHNTGFASSMNPSVLSLLFDPSGSGTLYAGDFYSGVYASRDGGSTWSGWPDDPMTGLALRAVKDLAFAGPVLYAATQGGGVFRLGGPAVVASPLRAGFEAVTVGSTAASQRRFTLHNTWGASRTIWAKTFGGAAAADFSVAQDGCTGTLAVGASCTFEVAFTPVAAGARAATLTVATDDPFAASVALALTGSAVAAPPPPVDPPVDAPPVDPPPVDPPPVDPPAQPPAPSSSRSGGCASGGGGGAWLLASLAVACALRAGPRRRRR